jgi:endonuclease III
MLLKKTGAIWAQSPRQRAYIVRCVCRLLQQRYGLPRFGNPTDPIDDLVYIVISNKTTPGTARAVYAALKARFRTWDELVDAEPANLKSLLFPAGLATVKAQQLRDALHKIRSDFGEINLSSIGGKPSGDIERYLKSLAGVSDKVAKCVMMYTMGAEVLPVDAHVHRITKRLGWAQRKRADQSHEELEALVPPKRRCAFHVDCVAHGRSTCKPANPDCPRCCINRYCGYYSSVVKRESEEETHRS